MKTCAFATIGCKVNQYETQLMREQFLGAGLKEVSIHEPADFYIINTCTVTHNSDRDARNLIRRVHSINPKSKIIAAGCYVERDAGAIRDLKCVDYLIPNSKKNEICDIVLDIKEDRRKSISYFKNHDRAFIKIQDGCNNYCTYCIVPFVRGKSRSRKISEISKEVQSLVQNGFLEVVLCGVCLGDFGKERRTTLSSLLKSLVKIKGNFRIRLSSIEPKDVTDELIGLMAGEEKICKHLHIPLQSGDDGILKLMGRRYSHKGLCDLAEKIYKKIPGAGITSDIIIGFPGENEESFLNTVKLLHKFAPLKTHIFTFSSRRGTKAADFKDRTSPKEFLKRREEMYRITKRLSLEARKRFLGEEVKVLVESELTSDYHMIGYSDNYLRVKLPMQKIPRPSLIKARVKKVNSEYLSAIYIS